MFCKKYDNVLVTAKISGLPDYVNESNVYGFHIHEGNSCTSNSSDEFADTLLHYNPTNVEHPMHAGDMPPQSALADIGKDEYKQASAEIAKDAITLVKYKDADVLPLTPKKYKRIMIVYVKGAPGPMDALIQMAMGGSAAKKNPAEDLRDRLIEKGFDAYLYVSPLDQMKEAMARGEKPNLNMYFAGKNAIEDFKSEQDLVITLFDVMNGRPCFGLSKGGGEIPWYVYELPVVGISVNAPTMLADVPQFRTYINAYDSKPQTMDALVENLLSGPDAFKGKDPIDSFCGLWDSKI